jgi:hypothetical protein
MRTTSAALLSLVAMIASPFRCLQSQSLAQRVTTTDGMVSVIYPSRPEACGDGESFIGHVFGGSTYYGGESVYDGRHGRFDRPCIHGPARVAATVVGGEVTRLRAYVGPVPASSDRARTITADAGAAAAWLSGLVATNPSRVASEAIFPLVVADAPDPWPFLLRVARDDNRPREVRRNAITWLATGVNDHLGLDDARDATDDDELRSQAVFALSQRPKGESVPALLDVARTATHASARRAAIFWLGQTGDTRALDLYAELLAQPRAR